MSYLHKEYKKTSTGQEIKFGVSFNRDRISWATSQPKKVGYQVTVVPVQRTDAGNGIVIEESGAFTGFNDCLLEVDRQSSKRLTAALKMLEERMEMYLKEFDKETV